MKKAISFILAIVMAVLIIPPATYSAQAADDAYVTALRNKGFTDSYIPSLVALHDKYPKWEFQPLMVGEDFSTAVSKERKSHKQQLIQMYSGNDGKGYYCSCSSCYINGKYVVREGSNWVAASQSAVEYYLDPRNFLNERYIFQFESTAYNAKATQAGVENILKGSSWLYNANITYKDANGNALTYKNASGNPVKYSAAIMDASRGSKMSAYYLASKIVQEVGGVPQDKAGGASGTSKTYPGIYNYYNINAFTGASDGLKWASYIASESWVTDSNSVVRLRKGPSTSTEIVVELPPSTTVTYMSTTAKQADGYKWIQVAVTYGGKSYTGYIREDLLVHNIGRDTYNRPWTNPYLSIYNGAQWIANNFSSQFTGYLQKFNVNPESSSMHSHEYMANVQAAASEASHTYEAYKSANMLSDSIVFTIPVFNNMPNDLPGGIKVNASNSGTSIDISWNKFPGAQKYRIFYKANGESYWHMITDTTSTNYSWTGAKTGTKYTFTVRCVSADGKTYTSSYDENGVSLTYVAMPKLTSISAEPTGIKLNWGAVSGAEKYRIFYKANGESSWHMAMDSTATNCIWTGAKSGTSYVFTIRCMSGDGKYYASGFNASGLNMKYVAAPVITSVINSATGVTITWGKVTGAEKYRVFYKANGESNWHEAGDTTATSYTWTNAKSGSSYIFTVRCISSDAKVYTSTYDSVGKSITYIAAPAISSVSNTLTGITVTWGAVTGAVNYRVYYKINGESTWHMLGDTTSTSYTLTDVKNGTKYSFTVRCINAAGTVCTSGYDDAGKSVTHLSAPIVSSVANAATGVTVTWGKVAGAEKYRVYYKADDESTWHMAGDSTSTSYTWTGAKSGTKYTFTVRCINAAGTACTSGYDDIGKSITYIAAPIISSVANTSTGITVTWGEVTGAVNYRVYYKTNGESTWRMLGDTTSTSYTWSEAKSGTKYAFTVRCINAEGTACTSGYDDAGKSVTSYIGTPTISSVANAATGVTVTWGKVTGAVNYRLYYKANDESTWHMVGDTASTSYTWSNVKSGTKYTFTVRCINAAGTACTSGYDDIGKSIVYLAAPIITSVANAADGVTVKWGEVAGSDNYRLYYKADDERTWHMVGDTTSTSYTWTDVKSGTKYAFTVRCVNAEGTACTSGYDDIGKSIVYLAAPIISSVTNAAEGITVKWDAVNGAVNYRLYYKANDESTWHMVGDTTSTSYTWANVKSGTKYSFTVRCINAAGTACTSGYDDIGKSITR